MGSFTAVSAITIIALGAMIEPTLAGPLGAIAGVAGDVGKVASGISGVSSLGKSKSGKRDGDITEAQIDFLFKPCYKISKEHPPTIQYDAAEKSGNITHLPEECMLAFELYSDEIDPKQFGHAKVQITSATSVHVDSIPPPFLEDLEKKFGKPAAAPAAKPTAAPSAKPAN